MSHDTKTSIPTFNRVDTSDTTKKPIPKYWVHEVYSYISNRLEEVSIALNELNIELEYYNAIEDTSSPAVTKMSIQHAIAYRNYAYLNDVLKHLDTLDNSKQYTINDIFGKSLSIQFNDDMLLKTLFYIDLESEQKPGEE